ncbi:MAG: TVP38/TMEM64 family protein [Calditrichaeota bacterium]|nr:TVP38/TMEM64 family protein [Calditrichota bacterium]MCB9365649.1 TVP38/TMEM64 family protein [Calditrichota bacterium]
MRNFVRQNWAKLLVVAIAIIVLAYVFAEFPFRDWLTGQLERIESLGALGYLWFVVLYIILTIIWFPASVLTLGAGAVFGLWKGSLLVSIGATLGATAAFLVGRYLARGAIASRMAGNKRFLAIDEAVGKAGFRIVFLTRLSPVFPFVLLNYAFGLTKVRLRDYVMASLVGMIPGTVLYVYLGSLAGMAATGTLPATSGSRIFTGVGLLATLAVTWYVTRIARRALQEVEGLDA